MTQYTFYFFSNAYSCSNLMKSKGYLYSVKDQHITNWGIISSIFAGYEFNSEYRINFDRIYVSNLLKTWETAACMFANLKDHAHIAPYLNDAARSYDINLKKFNKFRNYVKDNLTDFIDLKTDKSKKIFNYIKYLEYFQIKSKEKIKEKDGNLQKFMEWHVSNFNDYRDIAIVCNKLLIDKYFKKFGEGIIPNDKTNFCLRVTTIDYKIIESKLIYHGIIKPMKEIIKNINPECSLCENLVFKKKCSEKDKKKNKNAYSELLSNKRFYPFS